MSHIKLVDVAVETILGAKYAFPDVEETVVEQVLTSLERSNNITLVNASNACLILPTRIILTLCMNGVEKWKRP